MCIDFVATEKLFVFILSIILAKLQVTFMYCNPLFILTELPFFVFVLEFIAWFLVNPNMGPIVFIFIALSLVIEHVPSYSSLTKVTLP